MRVKSAKGVKGFILRTFDKEGLNYVFRVYHEDGNFSDYSIDHCDLEITIEDEDAFFYEKGESMVLDYGLNTLGLKDGQ